MSKGTAIATGVGAGIAVVLFCLDKYHSYRQRKRLLGHLTDMETKVKQLRTEVDELRNLAAAGESGDAERARTQRRRPRRAASVVESESTYDMYSAVETDADDDEFFDLSSDEGETLIQASDNSEQANPTAAFFNEVDVLMKGTNVDHKRALERLLSQRVTYKNNSTFLWRVAKAYRLGAEIADSTGDVEAKKKLIELGADYGRKAIDANPKDPEAHKWFAILTGMRNDYLGTKDKINNGVEFQKHLEIALELSPDDHILHYLLARFKFEIANLTWIEKRVASAVFGALPNVTMQDAIENAEKAEELSEEPLPDNRLLIAKCYIANGDRDSGLTWLQKANGALNDNAQNGSLKKEIESLLQKYSKY